MKFNIKDKVKVVNNDRFNGETGEVLKIHNNLDVEPVYTIAYTNSNNKGMFPESKLELIKE